jgi:outer membrane protein TolC
VLLLAAGALISTSFAPKSEAAAQPATQATRSDLIHRLRMERLDTLRQIVEVMRIRIQKGLVPPGSVQKPLAALRKAELELCTTPAERIRVHEQRVRDLRDIEKKLDTWVAAGRMVQSEVLETRARRLKAEIDLAQAQLAAGLPMTSRPAP